MFFFNGRAEEIHHRDIDLLIEAILSGDEAKWVEALTELIGGEARYGVVQTVVDVTKNRFAASKVGAK